MRIRSSLPRHIGCEVACTNCTWVAFRGAGRDAPVGRAFSSHGVCPGALGVPRSAETAAHTRDAQCPRGGQVLRQADCCSRIAHHNSRRWTGHLPVLS